MSKPQVPKNAKSPEPAGSSNGAAASPQPVNSARQLSSFENAMKLFHARRLQEARDLFVIAAGGPERDVAQRARLHISMCDRRLLQPTVVLASADEYYNYG